MSWIGGLVERAQDPRRRGTRSSGWDELGGRSVAIGGCLAALCGTLGCTEAEDSAVDALGPAFGIELDSGWATEPFTAITGAIPQDDGSLIVADVREGGLFVVLADGTRSPPFGSQGQGPGEYLSIGGIFPVRADTFAVVDGRQGRVIFMTSTGELVDQALMPSEFRGGPWGLAEDRLLARSRILAMEGDPLTPVISWNWRTGQVDTLGSVRFQPLRLVAGGSPQTTPFEVWMPEPFTPEDRWSTTRDGWLVILRSEPYRLERARAGSWEIGPILDSPPIPVSEEDRASVPGLDLYDAWDWPDTKPPFPAEADPVVSRENEVWIRTWREDGEHTWYDRLAFDGSRAGQVRMPIGHRLLMIVEPFVYTVETDALGLEWIRRGVLQPLDL